MKLLANENYPLLAVVALRDVGHDVLWARTDMPGVMDDMILQRAQDEERLVLTFDKDFGASGGCVCDERIYEIHGWTGSGQRDGASWSA